MRQLLRRQEVFEAAYAAYQAAYAEHERLCADQSAYERDALRAQLALARLPRGKK